MSIINVEYCLNSMIRALMEFELHNPGTKLEKLRETVIESLEQVDDVTIIGIRL